MNETLNEPGQGPHPAPTPPPSPHQDLDRLRRSTSNRYIAGVAGGLGRHFNIDPTIIRVLLVVLTFFGGAGLVVYGVCWLLVPEDDDEHAPIHVGAEPRKILLLAAAGIAFLLAVGDSFNGFDAAWPAISLAVILAVVLILRDRRRHESVPPAQNQTQSQAPAYQAPPVPPPPAAPVAYAAAHPDPTGTTTTTGTEDTRVLAGVQPPAWQPPVAHAPLVPPHPKRTGIVWFWPTLLLIGVGLTALGLYDSGHHVADGAYAALALALTGVMLLVGSLVGRPGGLILLGIVSSIALAASVAVGGSFGTDARQVHETPTSAALVQDDYHATVGEIVLDLTRVTDPQALAGRVIDLELRTGHIQVIVPRSLNLDIDADMGFAGGITVPGDDSGGINHEVHKALSGVPLTDTAPLELNIDAKFGQITVEQR